MTSVSCLLQLAELTEEQKEYIAKMQADKEAAAAEDVEARGPTSFFHGKAEKDYQVRQQQHLNLLDMSCSRCLHM